MIRMHTTLGTTDIGAAVGTLTDQARWLRRRLGHRCRHGPIGIEDVLAVDGRIGADGPANLHVR